MDAESLSGGTTSVCLPDEYGRVGATDGESYITLYAFGMETLNGSSIEDVLYSVKTTLQMFLIEEYLPEDCFTFPSNRDLQEQGVVGFRFDEDLDDVSVECKPKVDPNANCGIFEGIVHVFGTQGRVVSKIDEFFSSVDPRSLHQRLVRIFPAENSEVEAKMGSAVDGTSGSGTEPTTTSTEYGLSVGGAAAIVVTLMVLLVGVVGFAYFQRRRRSEECDSSRRSHFHVANGEKLISVPQYLPDID